VSLIPLVYLYFALHRSIVEPRAGFVEFSRRRKRRNGGPGHRLLHHHSLVRGGRLRAWTSMKVRRGTDHRPVHHERPRYPVSRAGCGDRSGHKSMAMTKRATTMRTKCGMARLSRRWIRRVKQAVQRPWRRPDGSELSYIEILGGSYGAVEITLPVAIVAAAYLIGQGLVDAPGN
jgi:hypothetical protein